MSAKDKCKIFVIDSNNGVSIWCDRCKENVSWSDTGFSLAEVIGTSEGHYAVMDRAEELRREYERTHR